MNKSQLIAAKEILKLVTAGPWESVIEGRDQTSGSSFIKTGDDDYDINFYGIRPPDQDFIALSRNLLPELLAEVSRLEKILTENNIPF